MIFGMQILMVGETLNVVSLFRYQMKIFSKADEREI